MLGLFFLVYFSKGGVDPKDEPLIRSEHLLRVRTYSSSNLPFGVSVLYIVLDVPFDLIKCYPPK